MPKKTYWADNYIDNRKEVQDAIKLIHSGQRIFIGSSCGEPQHLVKELVNQSERFSDLEIVRLLSLESAPLTMIANKTQAQSFNIRSFYLGSVKSERIASNQKYISPINLSAVPRLFKSGMLPLNAALIQVSTPDDFGWMSFGISVDITMAAAFAADIVIAQVNSHMPRVLGYSLIHVNDVDVIVEHEEELLLIKEYPDQESANLIGKHISKLVDDGSTIQVCLGATPQAILFALSEKNDLGVHTQFLTDGIMRLASKGVITNYKKGFNDGKTVASSCIGTSTALYDYINDNPSIEFHPSDYVNDLRIISKHNKMVSINIAMNIDLTGQVASDALPYNKLSGATGMLDFVRGSTISFGGKSILVLTATSAHQTKSRIVASLGNTAVVIPRGDVQYIVTEYGFVTLFGKNLQERALALISIAHPDFRDELFEQAKELGLISQHRKLSESKHGIYPLSLETVQKIDGEKITFRPSKPVDERRIQEHYYNLDKLDVLYRFFHAKTSFGLDDVEATLEIDYINDLTIIAIAGDVESQQEIIAVGEYFLNPATNMAEVAYSVNKKWQGKKIAITIQSILANTAREHGISGFVAYISPSNQSMIKLFKKLPYKTETVFEDELLILSCKFNEPVI